MIESLVRLLVFSNLVEVGAPPGSVGGLMIFTVALPVVIVSVSTDPLPCRDLLWPLTPVPDPNMFVPGSDGALPDVVPPVLPGF